MARTGYDVDDFRPRIGAWGIVCEVHRNSPLMVSAGSDRFRLQEFLRTQTGATRRTHATRYGGDYLSVVEERRSY